MISSMLFCSNSFHVFRSHLDPKDKFAGTMGGLLSTIVQGIQAETLLATVFTDVNYKGGSGYHWLGTREFSTTSLELSKERLFKILRNRLH